MPLFEVSYMCIPYIWVARLTRNVEVVGSSPIKGPRCFLGARNFTLIAKYWLVPGKIRA